MKKLLCCIFAVFTSAINAQEEKTIVLKAFQDTQALIAQKQYQSAQGRLEDMRVFGVYTDSIDYYMKVIDYHIDLDIIEAKYQNKRFQEARNEYDKCYNKYKEVIKSQPYWVSRCNTIIEAQRNNLAITPYIAKCVNGIPSGYHPVQNFTGGISLLERTFGHRKYVYIIIKKNWEATPLLTDSMHMSVFSDGFSVLNFGQGIGYDKNGKKIGIFNKKDYSYDILEYVDTSGNRLRIKYKDFLSGRLFHEGKAAVKKGENWGYINKKGKEVIPFKYYYACDFHEGLACAGRKDTWQSYIDPQGKTVIEDIKGSWGIQNPMQRYIRYFSEGLVFDTSGEDVYNVKGEKLNFNFHPFQNNIFYGSYPLPYSCGMSMTESDTEEKMEVKTSKGTMIYPKYKYGFINRNGIEIVPKIYDKAYDYHENYAWVIKDSLCGSLNVLGEIKIPFIYEAPIFHEAENNEIKYFLDGSLLPMPLYGCHHGYVFSEGLAGVKKNGKWGYVDYDGNEVIPFQYDFVFAFTEGFAWVKKDGKWGLIDKYGTSTFDY